MSESLTTPSATSARRTSRAVRIASVMLGGGAPVVVQSMTNTDTADVESTVRQIRELSEAGSELVRITVNMPAAAEAVPEIVSRLRADGLQVPIIGDFHFNGHVLLERYPACAQALDKYRINPGNVGQGTRHDVNFRTMIEIAIRHDKPVRIGVNWGSLDQDMLARMLDQNQKSSHPMSLDEVQKNAIVRSAVESAEMAEAYGLPRDHIVLSAKASELGVMVDVYRRLAAATDHALHLGLTEAGIGMKGLVASSAALGVLLHAGIGDTIRYSLTPRPGGDRREEVQACRYLLQALGLRAFAPSVTACPGCGRTTSTFFQKLAEDIESHIGATIAGWKSRYPGVVNLKVAVMGCIVNGPGESKHADVGISLPGDMEEPKSLVYLDGKLAHTLQGKGITGDFVAILDRYIEKRFSKQ